MKILVHKPVSVKVVPTTIDSCPNIIDGAEAYKTICPVSKESGIRENPLSMLESLANDPQKKRVLDSVLQELPSVRSAGESLPDNEKFDMLIHRSNVGTKAEVSDFIENSRPYLESLLAKPEPKKDTTIKFEESENPEEK